MKIRLFILLFLSMISVQLEAQLVLSGEIRPRYEFRNGYRHLPDHDTWPAHLISQRTRLNVAWKSKGVSSAIRFQDVRIWGDEAMKKDVAGVGLYEGWVEVRVFDSLYIKAGRQELVYDNQRLFSNNNWSQKAVTHDALSMRFQRAGWHWDGAIAFNQSRDTTFSTDYASSIGNYKALYMSILSRKMGSFRISALSAGDSWQKKGTLNTQYLRLTHGLMLQYTGKVFQSALRGFYQSGRSESGMPVDAYYAALDITASPDKHWQLGAGAEYQSGQDSSVQGASLVRYFTCLYGSGHSFNGSLDYFTKASDTKNTGLFDAFLNLRYKGPETLSLSLTLHSFLNTGKYPDRNSGGLMPNFLALEADCSLHWLARKDMELQAGYSFLQGSQTLATLAGGNQAHTAHWTYVMLTYRPVFLEWTPSR